MVLRVLVATDDARVKRRFAALSRSLGCLVTTKRARESVWDHLGQETFDFVLLDLATLGASAESSIAQVRALPARPEVLVVDQVADASRRAALVAAGCVAVLSPELAEGNLRPAIQTILQRRQDMAASLLEAEKDWEYRLGDFVSVSPGMKQLLTVARRVSVADASVLILGETGVGKESMARALHAESPRSTSPFVAVNCAAIPEGLFESELFGHVHGAFTGATRDHRGHFEMAHGGTLFLDEVGELPPHLQAKLLRVLQDRTIQRVGAEQAIEIDVRLMAATNRNPDELMARGQLREDLFYRLSVVQLELPPLRHRREDIPVLAENYFEIFCSRLGRELLRMRPEFVDALRAYHWPGNVRELINVMERAVLLAGGNELTRQDVPADIAGVYAPLPRGSDVATSLPAPRLEPEPFPRARAAAIEAFEKGYFAELLAYCRGRVGQAAEVAGISPRTLHEKLKRWGLRKEDFRSIDLYHRRADEG